MALSGASSRREGCCAGFKDQWNCPVLWRWFQKTFQSHSSSTCFVCYLRTLAHTVACCVHHAGLPSGLRGFVKKTEGASTQAGGIPHPTMTPSSHTHLVTRQSEAQTSLGWCQVHLLSSGTRQHHSTRLPSTVGVPSSGYGQNILVWGAPFFLETTLNPSYLNPKTWHLNKKRKTLLGYYILSQGGTQRRNSLLWIEIKKLWTSGGPVINNLPSNAGDASSIPSLGMKIPYAAGQLLSPCATTRAPHTATGEKPAHYNERNVMPQRLTQPKVNT